MAQFYNSPPGVLLSRARTTQLREQLLAAFGDPKRRHLPLWFAFPFNPMPRELLWSNAITRQPKLYLSVGKGSAAYEASGEAIANFFRHQLPVEDFDLYVFDDTLEWCIASTHELTKNPAHDADFLILGVGNIPR